MVTMWIRVGRTVVLSAAVAALAARAAVDASKLPPAATQKVDFVRDIQPLFESRCYQCHGPKRTENGLRLDDRDSALKGGERGSILTPGKSAESLIVHAVSHARDDMPAMPKKGDPLTAEQIGLLRAWIDQGADWPVAKKEAKTHWAFVAPVRPALPKIQNSKFKIRNPIDAFILARLEKEGLEQSPEADKTTLLRRLHFDLTGLPPSPEEVDQFLADTAPDAYERKVEEQIGRAHV